MTWSDYQGEIYRRGREDGTLPLWACNMLELEQRAIDTLDSAARGYIAASAGNGRTARANRDAFEDWAITPRMLRGVSAPDTSTVIHGRSLPAPLALAPVGVQSLAHPDAEQATARAAQSTGIPYSHSLAATVSFEEIALAAPASTRWAQLYWIRDPETVSSFLARAASAGFDTLILTVDTPVLGWRPTDLDRAFLPFAEGIGIANYTSDAGYMSRARATITTEGADIAPRYWERVFPHASLDWAEAATLRSMWDGTLLIKGIQHPDDAQRGLDVGFDGIIVSNHGGRQIDSAIGSLRALPAIRTAVGPDVPILFDSGLRTGVDLFTAIALGANAGMLGRAFLYGLALGGEEGVEHVIRSVMSEFELTMMLAGAHTVADITPELLSRVDPGPHGGRERRE
ncbi:alpha-hydroxy-acid oxidizing protein [uncultured Microbacterium sp.]|uniref:alpha-hydroxy-acid oxidizing protein n=1 Tax=uncultured Microbacterium sp. TaxID=191216 RepID=UPI0035C956CE